MEFTQAFEAIGWKEELQDMVNRVTRRVTSGVYLYVPLANGGGAIVTRVSNSCIENVKPWERLLYDGHYHPNYEISVPSKEERGIKVHKAPKKESTATPTITLGELYELLGKRGKI